MFDIPDEDAAFNAQQSVLFSEDLDVLVAGVNGQDCVLSGCAVSAQGTPDMTVAVAKGAVLSNGVMKAVAAANATIPTADGTNPRIDLVVINSSGAIAVRQGTAAASPKPPARTANDVVLARVYVPASDTAIASNQITDLRILRTHNVVIHKDFTTVATNNTTSAVTVLSLSIPNGLLVAGKAIRVRLGGNWHNNTAANLNFTFAVAFGGTTMYQDAIGNSSSGTTRGVWQMDFDLVGQGNSDQQLIGNLNVSALVRGGTTTGLGDAAASGALTNPIYGTSAVDADAADRTLAVTITMSAANANGEVVFEAAVVELL